MKLGILDVFKFTKAATFSEQDDEALKELSENIALQNGALDRVTNFVARGISKAKFVIKGKNPEQFTDWLYLLNVRPNPNQLASEFWVEIIQSMLKEGEALLVVIDESLYIVDSYTESDKNLKGKKYHIASVQDIVVDKTFTQEDVIVLKFENDGLSTFSSQLWSDYGELLGRLINRQKTANQIRFTMTMPKNRIIDKAQEVADGGKSSNNQKNFYKRVVERIKTESVVGIPMNGDAAYNEFSNRYSSKASFVDDIKQVKNQYTDDLAEILGIPSALIHGELADNQKNYEQAIEAVFEPLLQKIVDGLSVAIFKKEEWQEGYRLKAVGLHKRDLFDIATAGDKLIAAGLASADEIREEIGLEPLPDGLGKKLYITKNYLELGVEGGNENEVVAN